MSPSNADNTLEEPVELPDNERVIAIIRGQLGKPYKLGAEGPNAYDCSGLMWDGFHTAGLGALIGGGRHRANWYMHWFMEQHQFNVGLKLADRGDLIFYGGSERATHVGIFLGRKRIISALVNPWGVSRTTVHLDHPPILGTGHVVW